MNRKLNSIAVKFIQLNTLSKLELILYPVFLVVKMPFAWFSSLWNCRRLFSAEYRNSLGFHPRITLNSYFYKTQSHNLRKFGRSSRSPLMGLGDFNLNGLWYLPTSGLLIFSKFGAVTTLMGTLVWVLSHLFWLGQVENFWLILVIATLLLSTTSYAMAFARQNYQILGWMWFPAALYFLECQNWLAVSLFLSLTTMGGITQFFFGLPIVMIFAFVQQSTLPLFCVMPPLVICLLRFVPLLAKSNLEKSFGITLKTIGFLKGDVLYKRNLNRFSLLDTYYACIYAFSLCLLIYSNDFTPWLTVFGLVAFIVNQKFFRVADDQGVVILFVSLLAFDVMNSATVIPVAVGLIVASFPLGIFWQIQNPDTQSKDFLKILTFEPMCNKEIVDIVNEFLSKVPKGSRILFAFNNPDGSYEKLFDGYRILLELPKFLATKKDIHLFPDWWAVSETNYVGSPNIWGRELHEVHANLKKHSTVYTIIYQETKTDLAVSWKDDFSELGSLDWGELSYCFDGMNLWPKNLPAPKWFLLKRKSSSNLV